MSITRIKATNFKSFKEVDIKLNKLNILIGANASGKTCFIQIFKFLRDIAQSGLENAISMQGGIEYLKNIHSDNTSCMSIEIESDTTVRYLKARETITFFVVPRKTSYQFKLEFTSEAKGFRIVEDTFYQEVGIHEWIVGKGKPPEERIVGSGRIAIKSVEGEVGIDVESDVQGISDSDIFPVYEDMEHINKESLILENPIFSVFIPFFRDIKENLAIYDLDPKVSKKIVPVSGRKQLEENGENLTLVLKNILNDEEKQRSFLNLVHYIMPHIDRITVESYSPDMLHFRLYETYAEETSFPASLLSDGTIHATMIIIALFFTENTLVVIEEPDKHLHPGLISKILALFDDASSMKQILVTTHNPEMVKHARHEDVLLVSRNKGSCSEITRPIENREIQHFIENELGFEDLYVQNMLEI